MGGWAGRCLFSGSQPPQFTGVTMVFTETLQVQKTATLLRCYNMMKALYLQEVTGNPSLQYGCWKNGMWIWDS